MNTGVQIMWKEIVIEFLILYVFCKMLDIYMIKKYKKILKLYGIVEMDQLKRMAEKHLKFCNLFSVGPWNKIIYMIYNGLCWLLASIYYIEDNEYEFLRYLEKVKKENEFEMKSFVLFLYYRSKNDIVQAEYYYNKYLKCKHLNSDIAVIMEGIWNQKEKDEAFIESIKSFSNPATIKLFNKNHII